MVLCHRICSLSSARWVLWGEEGRTDTLPVRFPASRLPHAQVAFGGRLIISSFVSFLLPKQVSVMQHVTVWPSRLLLGLKLRTALAPSRPQLILDEGVLHRVATSSDAALACLS